MMAKKFFKGWYCDECSSAFEWIPNTSFDDIEQHRLQKHPDISTWESATVDADGIVHIRGMDPPKQPKTHFPRTKRYFCHSCGHDVEWKIEHAFVRYNGICPVLVCTECGMEVPSFAFSRYLDDGRVIIPV